ncbi:unnamed protein product [Vitrella brassicaformis CCMP3155]|uniref:CSN8/PSMD8/EIF3K domain-containing protein n=2 Tax=Vitrella brassicaformis TaxID=1169539 RepID=A0A0G4G481_VITBC|nr:unnamed protein product [Vitrella brassicaformis CCMP3155]|eukprot:CEM23241.1 unnamed protein product [Vitrella brassicaformis CCMP3155]
MVLQTMKHAWGSRSVSDRKTSKLSCRVDCSPRVNSLSQNVANSWLVDEGTKHPSVSVALRCVSTPSTPPSAARLQTHHSQTADSVCVALLTPQHSLRSLPMATEAIMQILTDPSPDLTCLKGHCEQVEILTTAGSDSGATEQATMYTIHMLACLYEDDVHGARFLWKRIPASLKSNADLSAAHRVLEAKWNNSQGGAFEHLEGHAWSAPVNVLAHALCRRQREATLGLIGRAYKSIRLDAACKLLNMQPNDSMQLFQAKGWRVDTSASPSPLVYPIKTSTSVASAAQQFDKTMHRFSHYMAFLEQLELQGQVQAGEAGGANGTAGASGGGGRRAVTSGVHQRMG